MSRYSVIGVHQGKEYVFTYGYDNMLWQYFLEKLEVGESGLAKHEDNIVELVGQFGYEGSDCLYGSARNLRSTMEKFGIWDHIPKRHKDAIISDLPF